MEPALVLITLGGFFLLGLLTDLLGRRTPLPRVTLLMLFGFAVGPDGADLLSPDSQDWFPLTANLALVMVGFLLGGRLSVDRLREHGRIAEARARTRGNEVMTTSCKSSRSSGRISIALLAAVFGAAIGCGDAETADGRGPSTAPATSPRQSPKGSVVGSAAAGAERGGANEPGLSPGLKRPHSLPLNNPPFVSAREANYMRSDDLVVGIIVAGQPRAYPWFVMTSFHVANDTVTLEPDWLGIYKLGPTDFWRPYLRATRLRSQISYIPIFIALCEACSGAAAFVPSVDGTVERPLVFAQCRSQGSPGNDFSAVGVYTVCDTQTHSRWHPFSGRAESGPLAGKRMKRVPIQIERWKTWVEQHPDTVVIYGSPEMRKRKHLSRSRDHLGGSGLHSSYRNWAKENPGKTDTRLDLNELVLGVAQGSDGPALVYPLEQLRDDGGFVQLEFAGEPYLFLVTGSYRALAFSRRRGAEVLRFQRTSREPLEFRDQSGTVWNELGEAVAGPGKGGNLGVVPESYLVEWVDWIMLHPGSEIFEGLD